MQTHANSFMRLAWQDVSFCVVVPLLVTNMKNSRIFAVLGILGLVMAGPLQAQAPSPEVPGVIVQMVKTEALVSQIEALGTLRANESIRVTSHLTRTVTRINFEDGQRVEKGRILVEMTSAEELAMLEEARINADEARKQLRRVESLVEQGAASESLLDQRRREFESARARLGAVQARVDDLRLQAPFGGVVGLRNISEGALVTPGDLITTLNDDSQMKLDFTLPAVHLQSLAVGLPIQARSRGLGDRSFEGEVVSIDNRIDPVTRAITLRALIPNEDQTLKQGLLMNVQLSTRERQALVVSEAAIVTTGSDHSVYVVRGEQGAWRVEQTPVTLGQRYVGKVEILSGLQADERVVTHGLQKVRDGEPVRILTEESGGEPLQNLLESSSENGA